MTNYPAGPDKTYSFLLLCLTNEAYKGKANDVTGEKFHDTLHEQVLQRRCDEETALAGRRWLEHHAFPHCSALICKENQNLSLGFLYVLPRSQ
jgi:hypothetical protein